MSRQSQDLDKFWLGNVDKNWEVEEDQGYEEEEKEGLLKTTAESKLTRDAVDEGDVRAARDDDMAIDTVKKSADAVDFSEEQEVAEDLDPAPATTSDYYYKQGLRQLEGKGAASSSSLAKQPAAPSMRKVDDDYDEDDEEEEGDAPGAATSKGAGAEAGGAAAGAVAGAAGGEALEEDESAREQREGREEWEKKQAADAAAAEANRPNTARLRKHGLLLLSEMFVGPSTVQRIARKRHAKSQAHASAETLSDDEDHFVDEKAQRAAAAASLRLREMAEGEDEEDEEEDEEDEEAGEGAVGPAGRATSSDFPPPTPVREDAPPLLSDEMGENSTLPGVGDGGENEKVGSAAAIPEVDLEAKVLQPIESTMWEQSINWGDGDSSSDDDSGGPGVGSRGDAKGKRKRKDDEEVDEESEEDEFEDDGGQGGGGGSGGGGGAAGACADDDIQWLEDELGLGGGGGDIVMLDHPVLPAGGGDNENADIIVPPDDGGVADKKDPLQLFAPRDHRNPTNDVRLGEKNAELEKGDWLDEVIWHEGHRRRVMSSRSMPNARRLAVQRGHHVGADDVCLAPHTRTHEVHECVPAWRCRAEFKTLGMSRLETGFDLSNDQYYRSTGSKARIKLRRPQVLNAPASQLFERPSNVERYRDFYKTPAFKKSFHGPILFRPVPIPEKQKEKKGSEEKLSNMKKRSDVTMMDSKILLVERYEEEPPQIINAGMGSRLLHYYRTKPEGTPAPKISPDHLNDGKPLGLDPQQETPFYGELPGGQDDFVSAMETNLYRLPMAKHQPQTNDFIVVKQGNSFYLREIGSLYMAGQTHPFVKVPAPNSKDHLKSVNRELLLFAYNKLKSKGSLHFSEVKDVFANSASDTTIYKVLHGCATFNNQLWTLKPNFVLSEDMEGERQAAETTCLFDRLRAGQVKLKQVGIKKLHLLDGVVNTVQEFQRERHLDTAIKEGGRAVQEVLSNMPWITTSGFVSASDTRQLLQLSLLVGSQTARRAAETQQKAAEGDMEKAKKQAADHNRKKQIAFKEHLESISQTEVDVSDEEEEDEEFYRILEQDEDSLLEGRHKHAPGARVRKITVAHKWTKERNKNGEWKWKCQTIKDEREVADVVHRMTMSEEVGGGAMGGEVSKFDKKMHKGAKTSEQKRRANIKQNAKLNKRVFGGDTGREGMTERVGKIRIKSSTYEEHLEKTKKELPDHLQGRHSNKGGNKRQRRKTSPVTEFNSVFEDVLQAVIRNDASVSFRNPVDVRKNPNYRQVIKKPIDLGEMRQRAKEQKYPGQKAFLDDVELMVQNCREYNRKTNVMLVSEAVDVQRLIEVELAKHKARLNEAESMIGLREIFVRVLDELLADPQYVEFRRPVTLPDYTKVIKNPMDLGTMRDKALAFSYSSREVFNYDLALIRRNCHEYCEKNHPAIPPVADRLYETGQVIMSKRHNELARLESSVGTWANTTRGTPGTSFPGTPLGRRSPGHLTPGGNGTRTPIKRGGGGGGGSSSNMGVGLHPPSSPGGEALEAHNMQMQMVGGGPGQQRAFDPVFDAGVMEEDEGGMEDELAAELDDAMEEEYALENDDTMMLGEGMDVNALGGMDDF